MKGNVRLPLRNRFKHATYGVPISGLTLEMCTVTKVVPRGADTFVDAFVDDPTPLVALSTKPEWALIGSCMLPLPYGVDVS